jgi:hypothetical protein
MESRQDRSLAQFKNKRLALPVAAMLANLNSKALQRGVSRVLQNPVQELAV